MGIFSWLQKNAPGSPGSTASAIAKLYNKAPESVSSFLMGRYDDDEFERIVNLRKAADIQLGRTSLMTNYQTKELVRVARGNMSLLVFYIMYLETSHFRASLTSPEVIESTLKVIEDVVSSFFPEKWGNSENHGNIFGVINFIDNNRPL